MLRALSVEEFAATSKDQYVDLAVSLGRSPALRQELRNRLLRQAASQFPFLDTVDYGRRVSAALDQRFEDYLAELSATSRPPSSP